VDAVQEGIVPNGDIGPPKTPEVPKILVKGQGEVLTWLVVMVIIAYSGVKKRRREEVGGGRGVEGGGEVMIERS